MKNQTEKLSALLVLCLQKNALLAVSRQELAHALNDIEEALITLPFRCAEPLLIKKELISAGNLLAGLAFSLEYNAINLPGKKLLLADISSLCKKIKAHLHHYVSGHAELPLTDFPPSKSFAKSLLRVQQLLQQNNSLHELYALIAPSLQNMIAEKKPACHQWVWWSKFMVYILKEASPEPEDLETVLLWLNYNTPAFKQWLTTRLNRQLQQLLTPGEKMQYLAEQFIRFQEYNAQDGYMPGQQPVAAAMLAILEMHIAVLKTGAIPSVLSPVQKARLKTALSVPQLALFIRLIVDMKIIEEDNYTGLLKTVAAVTATAKTTHISAESLRNNFYSPNTVAREVMKDYLIGMLNLVKTY